MSLLAHAGDIQLYTSHPPSARRAMFACSIFSVQQCVSVDGCQPGLRLNTDKTELMWTGSKYNVSKISVCCRSLIFGGVQVVGSAAVCVLKSCYRRICLSTSTSPRSVPSASSSSDNCAASDVLSTTTLRLISSTRSFVAVC